MNYRINSKAVALVLLLVAVAIALFAWTLVSAPTEVQKDGLQSATTTAQDATRLLTAKHQYRGGVHTIAGQVDLPTPCHKLVVEPFFTEPEKKVELRFSTTVGEESCATVVTPTPFKVTFEAPETININAVWDGAPVRLNLLPVGPDSSIDDGGYVKG
jgi:hypothetical protein